jgi:hypothetical protein
VFVRFRDSIYVFERAIFGPFKCTPILFINLFLFFPIKTVRLELAFLIRPLCCASRWAFF